MTKRWKQAKLDEENREKEEIQRKRREREAKQRQRENIWNSHTED